MDELPGADASRDGGESTTPVSKVPHQMPIDDRLKSVRGEVLTLVKHWLSLVSVSVLMSLWLCMVIFGVLYAATTGCGYIVTDQDKWSPDYKPTLNEMMTEFLQCRLVLRNLAYDQHLVLFVVHGLLKEVYDMIAPAIFAVNVFHSLPWTTREKRVLLYGLPALATAFLFIYHIGLGQPGLLRGSLLGTVFFYVSTFYCYYRVGVVFTKRFPQMRLGLLWPAVIIPFIVFYPFIYVYVIANNAFGGSGGSTSSTNKLIIRFIVHPAMCTVSLALVRHFARQLTGTRRGMGVNLLVTIHCLRASFGRFLLLSFGKVESLVLLQTIVSLADCVVKLITKETDYLMLKMLYGERPMEAISATSKHIELHVFEYQVSMIADYLSAMAVPVLVYAGRVYVGDVEPDAALLVKSAIAQVVVQMGVDLINLMYQHFYHKVDHPTIWKKRDRWFLWYLLVHFTMNGYYIFYVSIYILYCPIVDWLGEKKGLRMDYCIAPPSLERQAVGPMYLFLKMLPNNDPNPGKPLFSVARDFLIYEKAMGGIACRESSVLENCYLDTMQTNWLDG